jgi:hypothetical protein
MTGARYADDAKIPFDESQNASAVVPMYGYPPPISGQPPLKHGWP